MIIPGDLKEGDRVRIQITGMIGDYEAVVTLNDPEQSTKIPQLNVTSDEGWKGICLKPGDYILMEKIGESGEKATRLA